MKVLLDENIPKRLKLDFPDHQVFTVADMKWNSRKNGELLSLMLEHDFRVLVTFDQNIEYQQNFVKYPVTVVVLIEKINTYRTLVRFVPAMQRLFQQSTLSAGPYILK
ncbi:MAG: hypothetical protein K2U26_20775 [Cyclobacteriaceae bacterium]|nr:hypothetical protein [Cyclobacteriaceae bacterium]